TLMIAGAATLLYRPAANATTTRSTHDLAVIVGDRQIALAGRVWWSRGRNWGSRTRGSPCPWPAAPGVSIFARARRNPTPGGGRVAPVFHRVARRAPRGAAVRAAVLVPAVWRGARGVGARSVAADWRAARTV